MLAADRISSPVVKPPLDGLPGQPPLPQSAPHPEDTPLDVPVRVDTDALAASGCSPEAVQATCVADEFSGKAEATAALRMAVEIGSEPVVILRAVNARVFPAKGINMPLELHQDPGHSGVHIGTATLMFLEVPTRILLSPPRVEHHRQRTLPNIPAECFEPIAIEER